MQLPTEKNARNKGGFEGARGPQPARKRKKQKAVVQFALHLRERGDEFIPLLLRSPNSDPGNLKARQIFSAVD
jgi:hypothetical protein